MKKKNAFQSHPPPKANFLKLLRTLKNKLILISQQKMNKAYN